jgi:NDP-mannose synthase
MGPRSDLGEMRAIVLCGGRGTRLAPYTTVLPKPLMPLGDMPILELLFRQLRQAGAGRVTLAVGYLGALLMAYFGDGAKLGLDVDYSLEDEPLGTAAPLSLIDGLDDTFLVMNGDLLTDLGFSDLVRTHRSQGAIATVGTFACEVKIDLGVLEVDEDGTLEKYVEKPTHRFEVSMGVYVFEPRVLQYIPRGQRLDLPDLIERLLAAGERVVCHRHRGYWLDIGRPDDYQRAQEDIETIRHRILGDEQLPP